MTLIYDQTGVPGAQDALMQALRRAGVRFRLRDATYYDGIEDGVDVVFTDDPEIAADYEEAGAEVHALSAIPTETGLRSVGGSWYEVVVHGDAVDRVQGEKAAQQRLDELTTDNNDTE